MKRTVAALLLTSLVSTVSAEALDLKSGIDRNLVIELYTSEGCNSCPPAERWLNAFTGHPDLFDRVIPMAFHVDYWDYLGWKDPFATKANSLRQWSHKREDNFSQVYTPGMLVNSGENRGWWRGKAPSMPTERAGVLSVMQSQAGDRLLVQFMPAEGVNGTGLQLNLAVLGMGLSTEVTRGENKGKKLHHDFVVLEHQKPNSSDKHLVWSVDMPVIPDKGQQRNALVVWLTPPDSQDVVQAVAGFL